MFVIGIYTYYILIKGEMKCEHLKNHAELVKKDVINGIVSQKVNVVFIQIEIYV